MKFPQTVRHRKQVATIYGKRPGYAFYRVAWSAGGKRQLKSFGRYGDAKAWADRIVRELAAGSSAPALSPKDSGDALVARQALDAYFQATGRRVTLVRAVVGFLDADKALGGRTLGEAVDHFIATSASIKRTKLTDAVEAFLNSREPLTKAKPGERAHLAEVEFYTADEFRTLLASADSDLLPMLAIGGLAGLRTQEMLRLDWADVWRVTGHIEITAGKAKTRQRGLVEVCPALESWLDPYRTMKTGPVWPLYENAFHIRFPALCEQVKMQRKTNGLRHAFCSFHDALHQSENATAAMAGNSPAMIHQNYKGLATKAEAERWFNVAPTHAGNVI